MTTHRLAMGLYLPFLRPHSLSTSDSQSNAKLDASPQTHQARVGALTAAHALIRAGRHYVELACARPDLLRRKDGLGLSLCCGLVFEAHSGKLFSSGLVTLSHSRIGFGHGVESGYYRALFDACVICASSALRDPGAVWAHTAVEDAKTGLVLLRDLRGLNRTLDVSVVEALVRKLESGASSGSGAGNKRKRDGWDEGEGRDAVAVPGLGDADDSVPLVPVSVSCQELKLPSPPPNTNTSATLNTGTSALSSMHGPPKEKSVSEPRRAYPALVIPSKCPTQKDRPRDRDPPKDSQRERDRTYLRGDKEKEKGDARKKVPYPPVGYRVRAGKEASPLARGRTVSVTPEVHGMSSCTTTRGMLATQQSSTIMTPSMSMSSQPTSMSGQSVSASQLPVMSQPSSVAPPLRSLVSTPIEQPSYQSTPTPMSQEGGVDFTLPFGASYEAQSQVSQVCFCAPFYCASAHYLTRHSSRSPPKNTPPMTMLTPLPHRIHTPRTRPNMRNSATAVCPRQRQRLHHSLHRNYPITRAPPLPNHNNHSTHKCNRLSILRLKRPTTSNSRVASALVHNFLRLGSLESITKRMRSSRLKARGISRNIPGNTKGFIVLNRWTSTLPNNRGILRNNRVTRSGLRGAMALIGDHMNILYSLNSVIRSDLLSQS